MSAQVIDLTNRIEIEERSCKTVLLESVRVDLINQISRPLTALFHFCFQKRAGSLFINNNFVHDLGVFRNITGFVPQVCFASERRKQLLGFFYRCTIGVVQEGHHRTQRPETVKVLYNKMLGTIRVIDAVFEIRLKQNMIQRKDKKETSVSGNLRNSSCAHPHYMPLFNLYCFFQEDIMHRTLTVKEVLIYQANLRLPCSISKDEKEKRVNEVCRRLKSFIVLELSNGNEGPVSKLVLHHSRYH